MVTRYIAFFFCENPPCASMLLKLSWHEGSIIYIGKHNIYIQDCWCRKNLETQKTITFLIKCSVIHTNNEMPNNNEYKHTKLLNFYQSHPVLLFISIVNVKQQNLTDAFQDIEWMQPPRIQILKNVNTCSGLFLVICCALLK